MNCLSEACKVLDNAESVQRRHDNTGHIAFGQFLFHRLKSSLAVLHRNIAELDIVELGICLHHFPDMRQKGLRKQNSGLALGAGNCHHHRLSCSRRAVIHGSIGHVHSCQCAYHALILKDIAQCSLRDFSLVRSICSKEFRTGTDIRYHRWRIVVISAGTGKHFQMQILLVQGFKE